MSRKKVKKNDPTEWTRSWHQDDDPLDMYGSDTFPRDGRETIFDPYEALAPTTTVGEYALASQRVEDGDMTLPADFGDYLQQRVQSPWWMMRSCELDYKINRFGDVTEVKTKR